MAYDPPIPETRVLAIASHVVHGYVGNKMATFVMQSLGCDVSAINTVNYSNHTAYKQVKGTKTTAEQITELYEGLKQSNLNHFDLLLTGYMPSAEAVQEVGKIGRDLKFNASTKPGSFFWVLDPVMGDNGKLYIPEDEVPQYKALLREADLILPNQFEAETLSDTTITDLSSLATAIQILHEKYRVPHVIITSLRLTSDNKTLPSRPPSRDASAAASNEHSPSDTPKLSAEISHPSTWRTPDSSLHPPSQAVEEPENLTIIGSTATSDFKPRLFRIDTPQLPLFFSGTGDMFAALTIPRLIEAVNAAPDPTPGTLLSSLPSWRSPDSVKAEELPLAKACQKVLASMQAVLGKTAEKCRKEMEDWDREVERVREGKGEEARRDSEMRRHLALTRASEVNVVRFVKEMVCPPEVGRFRARAVHIRGNGEREEGTGEKEEGNEDIVVTKRELEETKDEAVQRADTGIAPA
ncbi:Ribokinase-like protein [Delitschia confertaspora ATCC 74209]|uniref:pyridoxal kinase n=1 Tax=Delitschia confertaspora ATCC 74209 TaxID=1513339 RepID=A0A9P4JJA1_9PLEO|nr:Ribokinase-like protein [Delitschia confertaspora ATCC 74209]